MRGVRKKHVLSAPCMLTVRSIAEEHSGITWLKSDIVPEQRASCECGRTA